MNSLPTRQNSISGLFTWIFGGSESSKTCDDSSSCRSITETVDNTMYKLMFMPPKRDPNDINRLSMDPQLDLHVTSAENNEICIMCAKPRNTNYTKCIIFSHGNAGDILSYAQYAKGMAERHNVLFVIYDYPGYGISEGTPTEKSCIESLKAVVNHVKEQMNFEEKNIILFGQSIGTGVTAGYAARNSWEQPIVLISPYESIISVVCYSSMGLPFDKFKTYATVDDIKCPVKIIHGEADEVIGVNHGKSLYKNLGTKAMEPLWLEGIGHNDILDAIPAKTIDDVINYEQQQKKVFWIF